MGAGSRIPPLSSSTCSYPLPMFPAPQNVFSTDLEMRCLRVGLVIKSSAQAEDWGSVLSIQASTQCPPTSVALRV